MTDACGSASADEHEDAPHEHARKLVFAQRKSTMSWHANIRLGSVLFSLLLVGGCESTPVQTVVPTSQSIAGLSPVGTVKLTEAFVGGVGAGKGELTYHGKKYRFELLGTIMGPGEALSRTEVAGDVYKLDDISQFPGFYAQGSGQVGLETAGASELWLENKSGVIMHLTGTSSGATLSLGRDEVIIRMSR
jgi:hypothetical protein